VGGRCNRGDYSVRRGGDREPDLPQERLNNCFDTLPGYHVCGERWGHRGEKDGNRCWKGEGDKWRQVE